MSFASRMCRRGTRRLATGTMGSPVRCTTSVGTCTAPSAWRTSMLTLWCRIVAAAPGDAVWRSYRARCGSRLVVDAAEKAFERVARAPLAADVVDERVHERRVDARSRSRAPTAPGRMSPTAPATGHARETSSRTGWRAGRPPTPRRRSADSMPAASATARRSSIRSSALPVPSCGPSNRCPACRTRSAGRCSTSRSSMCADAGHLPHQLDVRDEPGHEQDVERTVADALVRDAQVAALRVLGLRRTCHSEDATSRQWSMIERSIVRLRLGLGISAWALSS